MTITLTDPKGLTPTFYSLIHRRFQCKECGNVYSHPQVFAMVQNRGSGYTGVPCNSKVDIAYNLPVKVESRPIEYTPFCHHCWRPGMLSGLPNADPAKQKPQTGSPSWIGMGLKDTKPKTTKPKPTPKTPSIDDLDID